MKNSIRQLELAGVLQPDNLANYVAECGVAEVIEGRETYCSGVNPRYHVDAHVAGYGDEENKTFIVLSGNTNIDSEAMSEFKSNLTKNIKDRFRSVGYQEDSLVIMYNLQPTAVDLHEKTNGSQILFGDSRNVQSAAYNTPDHLPCNVSAARKITSELNDYSSILWNNFKLEFNDISSLSEVPTMDVICHAEAFPDAWHHVEKYVDRIIHEQLDPHYEVIIIKPKIFYNEGNLPCVVDKGLSNIKGTVREISNADGGGVFGITPNFPDLTGTALLRALAVDAVDKYDVDIVSIGAYGEYGTKNFCPVYVDVVSDHSSKQETDDVRHFVVRNLESLDIQSAIEHLELDNPKTYKLILKNLDVCEPELFWEKGGLFN